MNKKTNIPITFGNVLKKYRLKTGLTQAELSDKCGLDRTYISMLERGCRQPTISTLFQICKALEVKPSKLVSVVEKNI